MPRSDDSTKPAPGMYRKFTVMRTDGSSDNGGKHADCTYFVLDWQHDPFAIPAALAYAAACEATYPELARDLRWEAHNRPFPKDALAAPPAGVGAETQLCKYCVGKELRSVCVKCGRAPAGTGGRR